MFNFPEDTVLTKEFINMYYPEHGRTSCDDQNLTNSYGGWSGRFDRDTGHKEIRYPRCIRCYLLSNLGSKLKDLEFTLSYDIQLTYRED